MTTPAFPTSGSTSWYSWANAIDAAALRGGLASLNGFYFDPLHPTFGAVGDGVTDDTAAVAAAVTAARAVGGNVVLRRMFLVNSTIVQDEAFGIIGDGGVGKNVGLKAGSSLPTGAPLLWTKKTGSSTSVIEGHLYGPRVRNIRLDGNARTVNCKGWQVDGVTNGDFRDVQIRHFQQEGFLAADSVRETDFYHLHIRACGDRSQNLAAMTLAHSTTNDGHNNLHFYGLYVVYPYGVGLRVVPTNDTSPTRGIHFHSPMFHGALSTVVTNDDLTITPDWRHVSSPMVELGDARTVNMIAPRFHRSGYGQPLVLIRNNENVATTQNSVTLEAPALGSALDQSGTVTADATADTLTHTGIQLGTGAMVRFTTTGTLPAGLALLTDYYAIRVSDDVFKVATTRALAEAGTQIDLTDTGTGTHTVTAQSMSVLVEPAAVTSLRVVSPLVTDAIPLRPVVVNKAGNNKVAIQAAAPASGVTWYEAFSASDSMANVPGLLTVSGGATVTGNVTVSAGDVVLDNGRNVIGKKSDGTQVQIAKVTSGDVISLGNPGGNAALPTSEVKGQTTLNLTGGGVTHSATASGFAVASSAWNGGHLIVGSYHIWTDATGRARIKSSAPGSDTDGTLLSDQTSAFAVMSADDPTVKNASVTFTTSSTLSLAVEANATYEFESMIYYDCSTTADLKLSWQLPTGAAGFWTPDGLTVTAAAASGSILRSRLDFTQNTAVGGVGVGTIVAARPAGYFTTGASTALPFAFQFAQNTSDATNLTIRAGSFLRIRKVA